MFHPQTDGISERKNQWVKQYLHLVKFALPEDWTYWLAITTAVHNNRRNETTNLLPNQILLGFKITLLPLNTPPSNNETAEQHLALVHQKCLHVIDVINRATKGKTAIPSQYKVNDEVWLEASNLKIRHQKTKLAPKWYRPFKIIKEISPSHTRSNSPHHGASMMYSMCPSSRPIIRLPCMGLTILDHLRT